MNPAAAGAAETSAALGAVGAAAVGTGAAAPDTAGGAEALDAMAWSPPSPAAAEALEAARQQALLGALWSRSDEAVTALLHEQGARAARGLSAYRANAGALADRALGAAFPTVRAMLGEADFEHLAREFWRAWPPQRGDMGEWGDAFPAWLEAHAAFSEWPYLADAARVDLAVHRCERAADAALDGASLQWLQDGDPAQLRIELMPGTAVLSSRWPVATIYHAHHVHAAHHEHHEHDAARTADAAAPADFGAVRAALQHGRAEQVVVARAGWRAQVQLVDAATAAWMQLLLDDTPLGLALERVGDAAAGIDAVQPVQPHLAPPSPGFDFAAWLALALPSGWVRAVLP